MTPEQLAAFAAALEEIYNQPDPLPSPSPTPTPTPDPPPTPDPTPSACPSPSPSPSPDPKVDDKIPVKVVVHDYQQFTMKLNDNGHHTSDGDSVTITVEPTGYTLSPATGEQDSVNLSAQDKSSVFDLQSVENKVTIEGLSEGEYPPATLEFKIEKVELEPTPAPGSSQSVSLTTFEGSVLLSANQNITFEVECRRPPARGSDDPAKLARNMEKGVHINLSGNVFSEPFGYYGQRMPCGTTAHHIVPKGNFSGSPVMSEAVQASREILAQFDIHINSASNGVVLPQNDSIPVPGTPHNQSPGLHTNTYVQEVRRRLEAAANKSGATTLSIQTELNQIRQELIAKTFPH
ncbi:MAG: AHH domain-containing protein [Cyanobacteriota bacterium]|nr:AHH domain-containing protein [Cyanobacteriota bacterium]